MDFVALDVETANDDVGSICQIGLARYKKGALFREWVSLVDPEEKFSPVNIRIHGLSPAAVAGAPALPELAGTLRAWLNRRVVVCHTNFDQRALDRAFEKYGLAKLNCRWLDSCRAAKAAWAGCSPSGYGLAAVCGLIGHEFKHHDALEDAKAAGAVILAAGRKKGFDLAAWFKAEEARR